MKMKKKKRIKIMKKKMKMKIKKRIKIMKKKMKQKKLKIYIKLKVLSVLFIYVTILD